MVWFAVILVSAAVAFVITWPLWRKLEALESMCEMLAKVVRKEYKNEK